MKKNKRKPEEFNSREADKLVSDLLACAECMDGSKHDECKNSESCDEYVMDKVAKALDMTAMLQDRSGEKAAQVVQGKLNGFRCQNILMGRFSNKVSKALAEAAMGLKYTVDVISGRENVDEEK